MLQNLIEKMKTSYCHDQVGDSIIFAGAAKDDAHDRIPTSSSMQLANQEEQMPKKRKKKLAIFQAKKTITLMTPQLRCDDAGMKNGDGRATERNEDQRFIQKQGGQYCVSPEERKQEVKVGRRNKIFDVKRSKIYGQSKQNCLDADSTKRVVRKRINEVYHSSIEMKQGQPIKQVSSIHRLPFTLFRNQQFARLPSLHQNQQSSKNIDSQLATSHIQQVFLSQAQSPQRNQYQMPHYNPVSKKIKQIHHTKRRSSQNIQPSRPSFDKIFRTNPITKPLRFRLDEAYYSNSVGSRLSLNNTNLKENVIGHSLAACNIKQVDSSPTSECEDANQRYFDQQDERKAYPFTHKISYRNIEIEEGADGIEDPEIRHHNLFSDFECSRKKERRSIANSPMAEDRKFTKELFSLNIEKQPVSGKGRFHLTLVLLAVMMLFIQVLG